MSDPTKFPQMHIAESVFNRIMNMKAELLPTTIPELPQSNDQQIDPSTIQSAMQASQELPSGISDTAIQGADVNEALAANTGILGEGAAAGAAPVAAEGAGDVLGLGAATGIGAGAAGAGAAGVGAAAGAAVAGEAVATGAELLPLLALA